jgi:aryl-alcohol dehydrogenase-like predicted oxidoreductase
MGDGKEISRREFVGSLIGGAVAASAISQAGALDGPPRKRALVPARPLGKTGHVVCLFSLGGQATLETVDKHDEAVAIIHRALDLGVNYIDTSALYGGGVSERYIGEVMRSRREEVFLASKTHDRSYDGSMRLLERSLRQLNTDHLDLWQIHNVRTQEDLDFIFAREGVLRALERARKERLVRFIGITGHRDPFVLKRAIERHPFDTVLMAVNGADRHEASFIDHLLPTAVEKGMGIIGMKVPSRGKIFRQGGVTTMEQAMRYALTLPVSTIVIGIGTIEELEEDVRIAREFRPYTREEMAEIERLTKPYQAEANWYKSLW